jgi:hypothetical protein
MPATQLLLLGWGGAAALMTTLWAWHLRLRNAGIVDVGWAVSVGGLALFYGVFGPGDPWRRALMAMMMTVWGTRLAWYLLHDRVLDRPEDGRYAELRARGSVAASWNFFPFFQAQAVAAVLLSIPALLAALDPEPSFGVVEFTAVGLWIVSLAGGKHRGPSARTLQGTAGQPGTDLPRRALALLPTSQLLLRVADLGCLCAVRVGLSLRMAGSRMSPADALSPVPRHRDSGDGGPGAAHAWRRLSTLSGDHERVRSVVPERLRDEGG